MIRSRAPILAAILFFAAGCARMPPESKVPEPRATILSAMLITGLDPNPTEAKKTSAPVTTPQEAWVEFRKLYPEDARDCDGWATLGEFWLFSIRPQERKQEAGFRTFVYIRNGGSEFRRFAE